MLFTVEVCVAGTLEEEEGSHNTIYAVYHQPISMSTFMIKRQSHASRLMFMFSPCVRDDV
jgi:hypothetical protein